MYERNWCRLIRFLFYNIMNETKGEIFSFDFKNAFVLVTKMFDYKFGQI